MIKQKLRKLYQKLKSENGAVMIVEASFVFPIMFYVIFFLIFFGNMYVIRSAVSRYTSTAAIRGAEYYSNPWVKPVTEELQGKKVPTKNTNVEPYRHIFTSRKIQNEVKEELDQSIKSYAGGFFSNMEPEDVECKTEYKNYVLYSTFTAKTKYKVSFPIKFIFQNDIMTIPFDAYETVTVEDGSEFIRNTDMAVDYYQQSKLKEKIDEALGKVKEIFSKFKD